MSYMHDTSRTRACSARATMRAHETHLMLRGSHRMMTLCAHKRKKYGFDWLLIVAIMFKESGFKPDVVSWAGAKGLMQVLPVTAKRFGVQDLNDPVTSITAGVRVLAWIYSKLEDELSVQDRTWFCACRIQRGPGASVRCAPPEPQTQTGSQSLVRQRRNCHEIA